MDPLEYLNSMNTRRYKCCRSHVHVKKGAPLVGLVELFWSCAIMFVFIVDFALGHFKTPNTVFALGLTFGVAYCSAVALMFVGVRRCRSRFLIPHLVLQVLTVFGLVLVIGFAIFVFAMGYAYSDQEDRQSTDKSDLLTITVFIVGILSLAFEIWFANIVFKCYKYFKAKELYDKYASRINTDLLQASFSKCTSLEPVEYQEMVNVEEE